MPGFQFCSWCNGKGCMCCDTEEAKWRAAKAKREEQKASEDPRERLRKLTDPLLRATVEGFGDKHAIEVLDAEIEAAQAACDAEYDRQFPNGPTPIFTARADNAKDMELLKTAFHADVLRREFGPGGGGMAEIERLAAEARTKQDPPIDYKPIGQEIPKRQQ